MITPQACQSGGHVYYRLRSRRKDCPFNLMVGSNLDDAKELAEWLNHILMHKRRDLVEALSCGVLTLDEVRRRATRATIADGTYLPPPPIAVVAAPLLAIPTIGEAIDDFKAHLEAPGTLTRRGRPYTIGARDRYDVSLRIFLYLTGKDAK